MTPTVQGLIKKRNALRRTTKSNRREWLEPCKEAQEVIQKAKEESWKEFLEEAIPSADKSQIWGVVKSLNGNPQTNSMDKAMSHN